MGWRRGMCRSLVVLVAMAGIGRAEGPPRLRASWRERDARVAAFSPDGRWVISEGKEGFRLRDAESGRAVAVLSDHPYGLHGPRFSPDGRLLFAKVTSNDDRPVRVFDLKAWDVATGEVRGTIPYIAESINAITDDFALSPDGALLATLDNSARLPMDLKTGRMIIDGLKEVKTRYNASEGLPRVRLWSVADWREVATLDGGSPLVFSPDGSTLATGSRDWHDPTARLWDVATGALKAELPGEVPWMKPMAFSPDGTRLAIGGPGDETLWELADRRPWPVPVGRRGGGEELVFSPDGRLLFPNGVPGPSHSGNMNREFPGFDVSTLPPRRIDLGPAQLIVQPLTFREPRLLISPVGMRYAVFGEEDDQQRRTLSVNSLPDHRPLGRAVVERLDSAGFSPDGRRLAVLAYRDDGLAFEILDGETARLVATIPSPGKAWGNWAWRFSPDGRFLAVTYRTGDNSYRKGEPEPNDRPMMAEIWEIDP